MCGVFYTANSFQKQEITDGTFFSYINKKDEDEMKIKLKTLLILFIGLAFTLNAQEKPKNNTKDLTKIKHGVHFVDKDGDGYNDNAPDHDNDGVPNGLDPDYKRGMRRFQNAEAPDSTNAGKYRNAWRVSKKWNGKHRFANCPFYQDSSAVKSN